MSQMAAKTGARLTFSHVLKMPQMVNRTKKVRATQQVELMVAVPVLVEEVVVLVEEEQDQEDPRQIDQ